MKKKGFTLVELLAVIAILAILVIVAMPNVLGMFNQAKSSTFTTETQTLMDTASTKFMTLALTQQGQTLIFYNNADKSEQYQPLDMDGATKNYYVEMNRNGEFERVVVWDANFCYDSGATVTEKTDVSVTKVKEIKTGDGATFASGKTASNVTGVAADFSVTGCSGVQAQ